MEQEEPPVIDNTNLRDGDVFVQPSVVNSNDTMDDDETIQQTGMNFIETEAQYLYGNGFENGEYSYIITPSDLDNFEQKDATKHNLLSKNR